MGDEREDPDRAAILGRRNRLIALALSGIGAAAGCADPAPCLAVQPREPRVIDEQQHTGPTVPEERDEPATHPMPCLAPPPQPPRDEAELEGTELDESAPDRARSDDAAREPPPEPRRPLVGPNVCLTAPYDIGDRVVPRKP